MQVILKEKISGQGKPGQIVTVKRGFARNYLLPKGKAVLVNEQNMAWLEAERAVFAQQEKEAIAIATQLAAKFQGLELLFTSALKDGDSLYGSIGVSEIVRALKDKDINVDRHMVSLPEGSIRKLGEYKARIQLHDSVVTHCIVNVVLADNDD